MAAPAINNPGHGRATFKSNSGVSAQHRGNYRDRIIFAGYKVFLLLAAVIIISSITGCLGETPANIDWATPVGTVAAGNGNGIQETLDFYTSALVEKDRDKFASVLDTDNPAFVAQELQRFDRLIDVPFNQYYLGLISQSETAPGTVAVKVNTAYTLEGSFPSCLIWSAPPACWSNEAIPGSEPCR